MILFEQQLILNSSLLGTLVYNKRKITDDLLTISETFTWFYKIENIAM